MSTKKVVILIGAVLVVLSVFLPFITAGAAGVSLSFSLFDLAQLGGLAGSPIEIYLYIAGAALALITLILVLVNKVGLFSAISGLVALGAGIWVLFSLSSQLNALMGLGSASGVSAAMGFGLWVYLAGAVVQIGGASLEEPAPIPPAYPPVIQQ
jgi:hypothetical protein